MREKEEKPLARRHRSLVVDLLTILFGIGTWIGINGVFIQLPLLVEVAPEGWSLPSYLSVMVQLGNIGPLVYTLAQSWRPSCVSPSPSSSCLKERVDAYLIYSLLILATLAALFTGLFYTETAIVFGEMHSVALLALTGITAITACTSSVLFMPYMGRFHEKYLVTYFIGEGLSGLLPSVVALIQGIGITECRPVLENNEEIQNSSEEGGDVAYEPYTPPPLFGSNIFFFFICGAMLCSCIGFTLLDLLPLAKREHALGQINLDNSYSTYENNNNTIVRKTSSGEIVACAVAETISGEQMTVHTKSNDSNIKTVSAGIKFWNMIVIMGVISFFANGMFNSIQSYSCLPYGVYAYHLATTLSVIANPLACFMAIFLPYKHMHTLIVLIAVAAALTSYVFVTAGMSPTPPLVNSEAGAPIIITTWTLLIGVVSYLKLGVTTIMRSLGGKSLMWTGAVTQLGSLTGSLLIFSLINYTNLFQAAYEENGGC